jgi:membrane protein DedA with SNARE-associated domain
MKIFHELLPMLQYYIENYGSLGVFIASIIEEVIPPIPSALVQGLGGLLLMLNEPFSILGLLKLMIIVSIPAALGVCIGSLPYWYLAQKYGISIIEKYGKYLGTSKSDWEKLEKKLDESKNDEYFFIAARALPVVPAIVLAIYSGAVGMSFLKYFSLSFVGIMIRATVLGSIGWLLGSQFLKHISEIIEAIEKIALLAILLGLGYLFYKNYIKKG